jgi:hypothetical protein
VTYARHVGPDFFVAQSFSFRDRQRWNAEGIEYEERRAEVSQAMDETRTYGSAVPIVVWPDGRGRPALSPEECGVSIIVVYNSPS